jgi:pilin protein inverting-related protein (fragment)
MIYVGIDIAKLNHFVSAISSEGEILIEPFKFTNDADDFHMLASKLDSFDKASTIIGLESTAHYGSNLVLYLVAELYKDVQTWLSCFTIRSCKCSLECCQKQHNLQGLLRFQEG